MNLEAETVSNKVIKMGKGRDSAFGDDSVLETVQANVLKKPFSKTELENLINESLRGKDPHKLQDKLTEDYEASVAERLQEEEAETEAKYDDLITNVPNEKKIQKILDKQGEGAWRQAVAEREKELNGAKELQLQNLRKTFDNRKQYLEKAFRFFFISRNIKYPIETYNGGHELVPAVFLGFVIDNKKRNPFAPSTIKLRIAIANSSKYLAIPASHSEDIMAIIGASVDVHQPSMNVLLTEWGAHETALSAGFELGLTGSVVRVAGRIRAYTMGLWLNPSVFCVLLEVADRDIVGLGPFVFREFCRQARAKGACWINTMDDSGLPSLARAKHRYHPARLLPNYVVTEFRR